MGFYDNLFKTHKPLEDITGIASLRQVNRKWVSPADYFSADDAARHYNVAREVLLALAQLYSPDLRPGLEPFPEVFAPAAPVQTG